MDQSVFSQKQILILIIVSKGSFGFILKSKNDGWKLNTEAKNEVNERKNTLTYYVTILLGLIHLF